MRNYPKAFNNTTIWAGKPKRLYMIETDQKTFKTTRDYLDYKKTVADLKAKGYTNVRITCLGYDVTM